MLRSITIEDLYRFKFLSRPRLSPDGQRVAFVVTIIDERAHAYRSAIWMMPVDGGAATRFVGGMYNAQSPAWSPDGRWLAFVSNREGEKQDKQHGKGKTQLWLLPTDGGEARQLTFMPHGANNPTWSPDGSHLLFTALVGPLDEEGEDSKPLPKVRVIDRTFYRLDGTGFIYERRQHLFLIDVNSESEPRQLTDGDWDDKDAAWSPDGQHLVFTSNRQEDRWFYPCYDLYTLAITDDQQGRGNPLRLPYCLTDGTRNCVSPSWSPDGQRIAFLGSLKYRSGGQVEIFTIAADGAPESLCNLSEGFEGSCADWTNSDMTNEQLRPPPIWSPDGQTLYALAVQRGSTRVYIVPARDDAAAQLIASGNIHAESVAAQLITPVTPGNIHALDFSMDAARQHMAVLIETPAHPSEIFITSMVALSELRRLTTFNDALFDELSLTAPEYFSYTGADGWPMDGWVLKPPDFDPSRKYPLIVEIHGGPHTQYGYGFMHEMHMLAAQGYVVLFTNPRGSLGYGRDFALAVRGAWAEKDSLDILAGIDAVIQRGYIDEQRLGVIGGSYGGFMTAWLIGHSDRFKAAVSDRPVINRASFFGSSDIGIEFADDDLEAVPWDDLPLHMYTSPITYVKNIHTPVLIIHSEHDLRCNIEQSEQLFAALKYLGREVLFVRFEGQSHGLSRSGHPHSRLERLRHIKQWFAEYL
jgi:dipeptidyl aminopeptidase/acylaminoacyl peptidase